MTLPQTYYQLRRCQAKIVRLQTFLPGELWDDYRRACVREYAERLAAKFFPVAKKEGLDVYADIVRLYRAALVLAPITQRIPKNYGWDWTPGTLLSWVRRNANRRVGRFNFCAWTEARDTDPDRLRTALIRAGIRDTSFLAEAVDLFRENYDLQAARGRLANMIFDPFIFSPRPPDGNIIRIGNNFCRLEAAKFAGSTNVTEKACDILSYEIKFSLHGDRGLLDIRLSQASIKNFRDEVSKILGSGVSPARKVAAVDQVVRDFIDKAKYAKSAYPQIIELQRWLRQKLGRLASSAPAAHLVPRRLWTLWQEKNMGDKTFHRKRNFFWNTNEVPEEIYKNFFSPYRGGD